MRVKPLSTPIIEPNDDLLAVITDSLSAFSQSELESSVLVVTSKVVSLAENNIIDKATITKEKLVQQEAERYTLASDSKYGVILTVKNNILAVNAGVDESNVDNVYVLLPKDSYVSAERIWLHVKNHFNLLNFGVVITDSTTLPLKWGVVGRALAHCGFDAIKDMRGQLDLYGRELKITQMNIAEGIAAAAVLEMGEGNHATPLCLVNDVTYIRFVDHPPTEKDKANLLIEVEDDVYEPLLHTDKWQINTK